MEKNNVSDSRFFDYVGFLSFDVTGTGSNIRGSFHYGSMGKSYLYQSSGNSYNGNCILGMG